MSTARSALILSGVGRYADPWHPFEQTTPVIAAALVEAGYRVEVATDVDAVLASVPSPDLLVVNVGLPRDGQVSPSAEADEGLAECLQSGVPLLAFHVSATSFTDSSAWETALGGRWVRGISMHPDQDDAQIRLTSHPLTSGLADFTVFDERYTWLRVSEEAEVLAVHDFGGADHPLIWVREANGTLGRAAYDALGHDVDSFNSVAHAALISRLISWLGQ